MSLKLLSEPASYPITLGEAKAYVNEASADFDAQMPLFMAWATGYCDGPEGYLGRALIDQTWQLTLDCFPSAEIKIPAPPLIEIVSIKYDDASGSEQQLSPGVDFTVDALSEPGWVFPASSWPVTFAGVNAVRIVFRAGYLDETSSPPVQTVPADIKGAILLIFASLWAVREDRGMVEGGIEQIVPQVAIMFLNKYRLHLGMA